ARRDRGDGGFLDAGQAVEGHHDPPHRAEQADVRRDRTDVGEEFQVALQAVEFARGRRAHRALRALELDPAVDAAALADAVELAEAALEYGLEPADLAVAFGGAGIELGQLGAGPETFLEAVGLAIGAVEHALLAKDDHPG